MVDEGFSFDLKASFFVFSLEYSHMLGVVGSSVSTDYAALSLIQALVVNLTFYRRMSTHRPSLSDVKAIRCGNAMMMNA